MTHKSLSFDPCKTFHANLPNRSAPLEWCLPDADPQTTWRIPPGRKPTRLWGVDVHAARPLPNACLISLLICVFTSGVIATLGSVTPKTSMLKLEITCVTSNAGWWSRVIVFAFWRANRPCPSSGSTLISSAWCRLRCSCRWFSF